MKFFKLFSSICLLAVFSLISGGVWGQQLIGNYPNVNGGFEGAIIDNTVFTSAQIGKWVKNNITQTISPENSIVRSGGTSISVVNSTTGRRVWSPLVTVSSTTSSVTIQYFRRVSDVSNCQENQSGIGNGTSSTESLVGTYTSPSSANSWEKVTYTRSSTTSVSYTHLTLPTKRIV